MHSADRARALKAKITTNTLPLHSSQPSNNQDNASPSDDDLIRSLRTEQHLNWADIVSEVNYQRLKRGEEPPITPEAAYARSILSSPRITVDKSDALFNPRDYIHLNPPARAAASSVTDSKRSTAGYMIGGGKKRVRDAQSAEQDLGDSIRRKPTAAGQLSLLEGDGRMQLVLVEAVKAEMEDFWGAVANRMERETGVLFHPQLLEREFEKI